MKKIKLKPFKPRLPKDSVVVSMSWFEYCDRQQKAIERLQFMNMMEEFFPRLLELKDD